MARDIDWISIRDEYINTSISQRTLAEKYGISFNTLKDKANKEKWSLSRKKQHNKITTKSQQKTAEKIIQSEVRRIDRILSLNDRLTEKIDKAINQLEDEDGNIDTYRLRQIVQSMKDLREMIKDDKTDNNAEKTHGAMIKAIKEAVDNDD